MSSFRMNLSLTNKLFLMFGALGLGAVLISSYFSYHYTKNALLERTYNQLTSVRTLKKWQLENFFNDRLNELQQIANLSQTKKIVQSDFHSLNDKRTNDIRYFINKSNYFSNFYITKLKNPKTLVFRKENIDVVSHYLETNKPEFSIIDTINKNILLEKEALIFDFQIHLIEPNPHKIFIGVPLWDDSVLFGTAIIDFTVDIINNIMLVQDNKTGLGESGESYLVGQDYYMRSSSRFKDDSFLNVKVKTIATQNAFNNIENTEIISDYRGIKVLSSYGKINVKGLNWIILAEIDFNEVMSNIIAARNKIILITLIICLLILPVSYLLSGKITHPIIKLKHAINEVSEGSFDIHVESKSKDEIGSLTISFNKMAEHLRKQKQEVKEREQRLQHFYDATKDAIILHYNNIPFLINQTTVKLTGYSEEEIKRLNIDSFLILKTDASYFKSPLKTNVYESKLIKKDQTLLDVEVQENAIEFDGSFINTLVIRDISKRKKAEKALLEERKQRLSSLIDGQEMERQRLSRELHDSLGQFLIAIKLKLEGASDANIEKVREILLSTREMFNNIIEEVRRISNNLMPAVLYEFGIQTALSNLCKRTEETGHFEVRFYTNLTSDKYEKKIKIYIYRITQEALNNCVKHSCASLVKVYLLETTGNIKLIIKDNGKGFNFEENNIYTGNGLLNMKERATLINAKFEIKTASEQGTEISILIPYHIV